MFMTTPEGQMTFSDQFFNKADEPCLDRHHYVRMRDAVEWKNLYQGLGDQYCLVNGRPSKAVQVLVLLHMVKHYEDESDVKVVERLRTNLALQKACGLTFLEAQKYIDPSSMSRFRERIGEEGAVLIAGEVDRYLDRKRVRKGKCVVLDTTVSPSNIAYPTDISLLEKARQLLLRFIKRYKKWTGKSYRTKSRKARKEFLLYIKLKRRNRKLTKKVQGKMIRFVRRNQKQAEEVMAAVKEGMGAKKTKMIERWEKTIAVIRKMQEQQTEIWRKMKRSGVKAGIHISDRIVSIFRPYVRPMPRGKTPVATEFGGKLLAECRNGFLRILSIVFDNKADCEMASGHIWNWKGMNIGGDRGMDSPENKAEAAREGANYLVERRGKTSQPKTNAVKRIRGKRAVIEAKYSLGKRCHGLGRVLYNRGAWSEKVWIEWGVMAMNLKLAFKRLQV